MVAVPFFDGQILTGAVNDVGRAPRDGADGLGVAIQRVRARALQSIVRFRALGGFGAIASEGVVPNLEQRISGGGDELGGGGVGGDGRD